MAENDDKIVEQARNFAKTSNGFFSASMKRMKQDLIDVCATSFGPEDRAIRGSDQDRIEVVIPLMRNYCNQYTNKFKSKPVGVNYQPLTEDAAEQATMLNAIVKGIMSKGGAHSATVMAVDRQAKGGRGYLVIRTDYLSSASFDQEFIIEGISKPDMVIWDPYDKSVAGRKASECILVDHMSKAAAQEEYGEDIVGSGKVVGFLRDTMWAAPPDAVEVATYFRLKRTKSKIYMSKEGTILQQDQVRKDSRLKSRTITKVTCEVHRIVGNKLVHSTELPLSRLPVIPFLGELIDTADGQQDYVGLTYFGRPEARLVNYSASQTAERLARTPNTNTYVDYEAIEPYLDIYEKLNRLNLGVVPLKLWDEKNRRERAAPVQLSANAQLGDVTGAMDMFRSLLSATLGQPEGGSEVDGPSNQTATEVLTKSRSSDLATFALLDNATQSIMAMGEVLLDLLPVILDTEREMDLVDSEGVQSKQTVDASTIDPAKFKVDVQAGPLYATQMQEEQAKLLAFASLLGQEGAWAMAPDIIKASGMASSKKLADKVEKIAATKLGLPVESANPDEDPEAVAALQRASQVADMLQQQLEEARSYARYLEGQVNSGETEAKASLIKQQMADDTRILIERMKLAQADQQAQSQLQLEYDKLRGERMDALAALYKQQTAAPVSQAHPEASPIGVRKVFAVVPQT